MKLPFTPEQFFEVFGKYNETVWPLQVLFYVPVAAVLYLVHRHHEKSGRLAAAVLAFFWAWMAIAYHVLFFSDINPAALLFAGADVVQALIFVHVGVIRNRLQFAFTRDWYTGVSAVLLAYALILYPSINTALGHGYPRTPTFGLPCPTTIFTFAVLLLATTRVPYYVLVLPSLWAIIGFMAALQLDVPADWMLLIAALVSVPLIALKNAESQSATEANT